MPAAVWNWGYVHVVAHAWCAACGMPVWEVCTAARYALSNWCADAILWLKTPRKLYGNMYGKAKVEQTGNDLSTLPSMFMTWFQLSAMRLVKTRRRCLVCSKISISRSR